MPALTNTQTQKAPRFAERLHAFWQRIARRSMPATHTSELTLEVPAAMSDLLTQAVRENSNHEFDWLWYASQTQSDVERHYCLARARYINPHSEIVRTTEQR